MKCRQMIFFVTVLIALSLVKPAYSLSLGNVWISLGPEGTEVRSLAVSPSWTTDQTIVFGSWYQPGLFYRSSDGGATWWSTQPLGDTSYYHHFDAIALSPNYQYGGADQTVFLGGGNSAGVYHSTDSGINWLRETVGTTWDFAVSPNFATDGTVFVAGNSGIHKSVDWGGSFIKVNDGLPGGSHFALAISPNYPNDQTIFVGTYYGVYKSTDGGSSWALFNNGLPASEISSYPNLYDIVISPNYANDQTIFVGVYTKGIYKSTDGGTIWSLAYPNAYVIGYQSLAISPNYALDGTLFVGTTFHYGTWTGVVISQDGGNTWSQMDNTGLSSLALEGTPDVIVSADFVIDKQIFIGTRDGVWTTFANYCDDTDTDGDGVLDVSDNCIDIQNPDQADTDGDGEGDACDQDDDNDGVFDEEDNCSLVSNADQTDTDGDGTGDECDEDLDGDNVLNAYDNCPADANVDQIDTDGDGEGDECDTNDDNDAHDDTDDNCPTIINDDQADLDGDGIGDLCDVDVDGDGIDNVDDNCPERANASQDDTDFDGPGDACDDDDDNDGILDGGDNCSLVVNPDQDDTDGDGKGDPCDDDLDGDGVDNDNDNCPSVANSGQSDFDGDGLGDACDPDIDDDGVANGGDLCAETPLGEIVDPSTGCTIDQLCPCDGPRGTNVSWRNHGKYVSCVAKSSENFVEMGLITEFEKDEIVSVAAQSECGDKK